MADPMDPGSAPLAIPEYEWNASDGEESLRRLKAFATSRAASAIDYYRRVRLPKKWWAIRLRIIALLCAGISGILPILSQIIRNDQNDLIIAPAWASVFLALAAGGVAIDRYFGLSSAWMRFMSTELKLSRALDRFELDWESVRAGITGSGTSRVDAMMTLARDFIAEVAGLVSDETGEWITEFQDTIRQLDQRTGRPTASRQEPDTGIE